MQHGIGLSIVKSVIEQHKGKIEVKSSGMGAAFTIIF
jgi:signal transduction histidine kinase